MHFLLRLFPQRSTYDVSKVYALKIIILLCNFAFSVILRIKLDASRSQSHSSRWQRLGWCMKPWKYAT